MLGAKSNPYCYMEEADLLVVPSRYESYPTVINEAKIVGTPIVCRDFPSASEIMDENCGLILPIEQFAEGIQKLLDDENKYQFYKRNLSDFKYPNGILLEQLYRLID